MSGYDIAVIGGGPAGYVAAIKAAMLGARVVLFERIRVGGACLNRGCIPTKSYVKTADTIRHIREARIRGIINDPTVSVDMNKVVDYKDGVVKKLTGGVAALLTSHGVKTVNGGAVLKDATTVICGKESYKAGKILLCGGSMVGGIPIPGVDLEGVLDSDAILELRELPKRLCIIGGGVIGCEIAAAFAEFGSRVTIVEVAERPVPMLDAEISELVRASLKSHGIDVQTGKQVERIEKKGDELAVIAGGEAFACDKVLLSVGRKADLSCLGALENKITCARGFIQVDDDMRTNIPTIFAPGDINGRSMLAHAAFKMGEVAAENAVEETDRRCNLFNVPCCVYTIPEASGVGFTEKEAADKYGRGGITVGKFPFAANGRALASGEGAGLIKVIACAKYGEILGVHMFGPGVTELIAEAATLMDQQITIHEASEIIHPHPTYAEAFMEACADALGSCIHLPKNK